MKRLLLLAALPALLAGCPSEKKDAKKPKGKGDTSEQAPTAKSMLKKARRDKESGDYAGADKAYAEAYKLESQFEVLEEWVAFLSHNSKAERGVEVSKTYYDAHGSDVKGYYIYCEALIAAGKGTDALDVSDSILAFNAQDPRGHELRGRTLLLLERDGAAVEELKKARDLDPGSAKYHVSLGLAYDKLGKIDEAQLEFRAGVKGTPDNADANVYLGMALREQQSYDEAKKFLEKGLELDPKNGRAYFELGRMYNAQHKDDDAEAALGKAVALAPNESLYWYAYGEIYRVRGNLDEAIEKYKRAVEIDPPYPKALTKLGLALVERKQWDEAERVLTIAIRKSPREPANYMNLGAVYAGQSKSREAIDFYEKFLDLAPKTDPQREKVRQEIQRLKLHP